MCDYSLHAIASRPARVGEALVSTHFRGSATLGFASPVEKGVAVCLLPGTELAFETNVRYRAGWFKTRIVNFNVAKFCKIAPEVRCQHHDALAFPDGSTVLVNSLVQRQRSVHFGSRVTQSRLPFFPQQQTFANAAVTSEKCQQRTHAPQQSMHPASTPGRRALPLRIAQAATAALGFRFGFQFQGSRSTTLLAG
jgi:hypothetical protein